MAKTATVPKRPRRQQARPAAAQPEPGPLTAAEAIGALSALAHPGRLDVFRLLVRAGPEGLAAGMIAQELGSLPNTLSANLQILSNAGLVRSNRHGRSIVYSANYDRMRALLAYLMEDCCDGCPEVCMPIAKIAERCCG